MNKRTRNTTLVLSMIFSTLLLTACGGSTSDSNATIEHPQFDRENIVAGAANDGYAPQGEINTNTPEFTFKDTSRVSNPIRIGYTDVNNGGWNEFSIADADCIGIPPSDHSICTINPGITFSDGAEIAWWVQHESRDGIFWVENVRVFTVPGGDGGGNGGSTTARETWTDFDSNGNAVLAWTHLREDSATINFQIGYYTTSADWKTVQVSGKNAFSTNNSYYVFRTAGPDSEMDINSGEGVTWWVREWSNGEWQDWNDGEGSSFTAK